MWGWAGRVKQARIERAEAARELEETRRHGREVVDPLVDRAEAVIRRNHFGEAIENAMGKRRHA
ncbi:DUF7620 family protein [Rhodococcus ruber]|uniref:DUF7620 family protein n=1 Tax=Rhodococcus ruber TaxID=1830 RepID=UPI0026D43A9D